MVDTIFDFYFIFLPRRWRRPPPSATSLLLFRAVDWEGRDGARPSRFPPRVPAPGRRRLCGAWPVRLRGDAHGLEVWFRRGHARERVENDCREGRCRDASNCGAESAYATFRGNWGGGKIPCKRTTRILRALHAALSPMLWGIAIMSTLSKHVCMRSCAVKIKTVVVRLMIDKHPIVGDARHMALPLADKIAGQRMVLEKLCRRGVVCQFVNDTGKRLHVPMPPLKKLEAALEV